MAEPLQVPTFSDGYTRALIACGELATDDEDVLRKLADARPKSVIVVVGEGDAGKYVRLLGASKKWQDSKHLHLEVAASGYFAKKPEVNDDAGRLFTVLEQFYGQEIRVHVVARFEIPSGELDRSGLGRMSNIRVNLGDFAIEQTAAEFKISGVGSAGVVEVSVKRSTKIPRVDVELLITEQVDSGYLVRLHALTFDAFNNLILGEKADVKK